MGVRVAVVGGGIAGLAAAWELSGANSDLEIDVLEGADRVGGKLRREGIGGSSIDVGAESVLARRPEAVGLVTELGLGPDLVDPARLGASIVAHGRRWPVPSGTLMGVPADPETVRGLLSDREVERLRAEQVPPALQSDVAVGRLVDVALGPAVTDLLVEPLLAGVYAGHSRALSLEMSIPALYRAAQEGRSLLEAAAAAATAPTQGSQPDAPVFATLRGGLARLPEELGRRLAERGVRVRLGTMVRGLRQDGTRWTLTAGPTIAAVSRSYDAVVLATPAAPATRLITPVSAETGARLKRIEYASMAIVTVALDGPPPAWMDGSGFLVPPNQPFTIKAATFSSVKWPWLADERPGRTFLRISIGRHREEPTLQQPDAELARVALSELATVVGHRVADPVAVHVQRWGGGLPQYAPGHRDLVEQARSHLPGGVALAGAAYDGVGIPACIASGRRAAQAVLTHLRLRPEVLG